MHLLPELLLTQILIPDQRTLVLELTKCRETLEVDDYLKDLVKVKDEENELNEVCEWECEEK